MFTLFMMMFLISMLFIFMNHPLSMGMILLAQTILITLTSGFMTNMFWYSYILFMIMISGLLIIFLYMTSIASNKKFKFSFMLLITIMISIVTLIFMKNNFMMNYLMHNKIIIETTITKFYNFPSNSIMIMLMLYLLITLIAVVNLTKMNQGSLRQK